jgi:4-hydroxy-3-polyprenylbenzoate decarboxylase
MRLLREECAIDSLDALRQATGGDWSSVVSFPDDDRGALPASGSRRTSGMVICPCSMGTLAAVAGGTSRSLVERAADVTLKEGRKLTLVVRETPLSRVHLRNMLAVAESGATVVPASPGFYHRPTRVDELVDFVVQRVLDQVGLELEIAPRWGETSR